MFWIRDPLQSVVLEVHADLRLVQSKVSVGWLIRGAVRGWRSWLAGVEAVECWRWWQQARPGVHIRPSPHLSQIYASSYSLRFPRVERIR